MRLAAAGLALSVLAIGGLYGTGLAGRFLSGPRDLEIRAGIWQSAARLVAERPLTGFGLDSFALAFPAARSAAAFDASSYADAHSTYLENWAEAGLIFGSAPLVAGLLALSALLGRWRRARGAARALPAAALGALLLAALHSSVDFPFEMEANLMLLVAILGLALAPDPGPDTTTPWRS